MIESSLHFEKRGYLGGGGCGSVSEAYDTQLDAEIAIKTIHRSSFTSPEEYFEESRKLYLTRHHNIVKINYATQDAENIYLSMPLYRRGSVRNLMEEGFLSPRRIIRYSLQFLSGLNNIHAKRLVHFDIKPSNILISDSDQALVSDFGQAKFTKHYGFADRSSTTLEFAPPEFFSQSKHDLKFDIYQAGLTLYQMCNGLGHLEDQLDKYKINGVVNESLLKDALEGGKYPDRNSFLPHIPNALIRVIKKATAVNPDDRYSTVIKMLNDLSNIDTAKDWVYEKDQDGNERWEMSEYVVRAFQKNLKWEVITERNARRITNHCHPGLDGKEKQARLRDCLCGDLNEKQKSKEKNRAQNTG